MREVTEFSVGDVLRTALLVAARNLPAFLPMTALAVAPMLVADPLLLTPPQSDGEQVAPAGVGDWLVPLAWFFALGVVCAAWLQGGLAWGVVRSLRGGRAGFAEMLFESIRRLPVVLAVSLATTAAIAVGTLLLIVPGIVLGLLFWVVVPAAVVERLGFAAAIRRSVLLTKDHLGPIFGLGLIVAVLNFGLPWALVSIVGADADRFWIVVIDAGVSIALGVFMACVIAVAYHDLRVLADGADQPSPVRPVR